MRSIRRAIATSAAVTAVALLLGACGGGSDNPVAGGTGEVRTVEVRALDTLRFEPASIDAKVGERVRFVVTNAGQTDHEFVLGNEEIQEAHEQTMGTEGHMEMEAMAALELKPGETKEATVTFDESGKILFGCHLVGHYKGGMVGTVTVG